MVEISVKKIDNNFIIRWQLSKVEIPASEILNVHLDDTYGGDKKAAIRIGLPYGTTDRVVIETKKQTYILFTSNPSAIMKKLSA
ncbi:hypothetical protein ABE65_005995 [Fictibacillus phosphorivorans]|uniref:Sublancin immunity protein SunI-like PH domain-containing protein n=1 Tax=Fictibacillus phosphorivorans TaxID=1221500 RepID=A0A160IJS7_9BACL|nr:hypothetical protein [Fictibacillus phosphorivorans]ANC76378.1 hypothetical protein ABE65_005995 [Fictibacillus phosphorivorans]